MIKGARKEMIVVRTSNSRYFDEAYFVLREDTPRHHPKSTDILNEANRILAETVPDASSTLKKRNRPWVTFVVGGFFGAVLSLIVTLLLI